MSVRNRGFVALHAIVTLTLLMAIVALVLVRWGNDIQRHRRVGGLAVANRAAHEVIQRELFKEFLRAPRLWSPPMAGTAEVQGVHLTWTRRPVDSRFRAGARPWSPEMNGAWERLGAKPDRLAFWSAWMERRFTERDPNLGFRGDIVTDPGFLKEIFNDSGLATRWGGPEGLWTMEEAGALVRPNLLGADPQVASALTGVSRERIQEFAKFTQGGLVDATAAQTFWNFSEWQAIQSWMAVRPFSESIWVVEARVPNLKDPIITRWRSGADETLPGNPVFKVRPMNEEVW